MKNRKTFENPRQYSSTFIWIFSNNFTLNQRFSSNCPRKLRVDGAVIVSRSSGTRLAPRPDRINSNPAVGIVSIKPVKIIKVESTFYNNFLVIFCTERVVFLVLAFPLSPVNEVRRIEFRTRAAFVPKTWILAISPSTTFAESHFHAKTSPYLWKK